MLKTYDLQNLPWGRIADRLEQVSISILPLRARPKLPIRRSEKLKRVLGRRRRALSSPIEMPLQRDQLAHDRISERALSRSGYQPGVV